MVDRIAKLRRAHGLAKPCEAALGDRSETAAGETSRAAVESGSAERTTAETLRALRSRLIAKPRERVALPPEGAVANNARGAFWLRTLRLPPTVRHGLRTFSESLAGLDRAVLAARAKDDRFADLALADCLFLDTETTGLHGGAGTVVFLTGVAFFDGDDLVVEQVFLRSFEDEAGALQHVATRLAEHPVPVTFVGKTFDRHRLAARMALHRIPTDPVMVARHLDLYYVARRTWGAELPDVRLRTVEEHKLGLFRRDDLPGREAPAAWLRWMQDGTGAVDRVLEHNRLDVLSLVGLLGRLARPSS
jgi:uncharacterized protein YprB with RNaseH-like and TPR domain